MTEQVVVEIAGVQLPVGEEPVVGLDEKPAQFAAATKEKSQESEVPVSLFGDLNKVTMATAPAESKLPFTLAQLIADSALFESKCKPATLTHKAESSGRGRGIPKRSTPYGAKPTKAMPSSVSGSGSGTNFNADYDGTVPEELRWD